MILFPSSRQEEVLTTLEKLPLEVLGQSSTEVDADKLDEIKAEVSKGDEDRENVIQILEEAKDELTGEKFNFFLFISLLQKPSPLPTLL